MTGQIDVAEIDEIFTGDYVMISNAWNYYLTVDGDVITGQDTVERIRIAQDGDAYTFYSYTSNKYIMADRDTD